MELDLLLKLVNLGLAGVTLGVLILVLLVWREQNKALFALQAQITAQRDSESSRDSDERQSFINILRDVLTDLRSSLKDLVETMIANNTAAQVRFERAMDRMSEITRQRLSDEAEDRRRVAALPKRTVRLAQAVAGPLVVRFDNLIADVSALRLAQTELEHKIEPLVTSDILRSELQALQLRLETLITTRTLSVEDTPDGTDYRPVEPDRASVSEPVRHERADPEPRPEPADPGPGADLDRQPGAGGDSQPAVDQPDAGRTPETNLRDLQ